MSCMGVSGYAVEGKPRYRVVSVGKVVVGDIVSRDSVRFALSYPSTEPMRVTQMLHLRDGVVIVCIGIGTEIPRRLHRQYSAKMLVVVR